MLVWVAVFVSTTALLVRGQDVSQPNKGPKLPIYKEKLTYDGRSRDNYFQSKPPPMGAGTYQYYDTKGILHIANYVNDMYGFRILSEYTPFAPLGTLSEPEKPKKPPKRSKFNIETFDMFDEVEEPTRKPKKENSKVAKENATSEVDQQPEPSTVSETVNAPNDLRGRMPSGTFKWPSYPSVMEMARSKAEDSKYFYPPRIFFYENRPLPVTFQTPTEETSSTPAPPKETTTIPSTSTAKTEEPPAQITPTVSTRPFAGYFAINHSPAWAGRPAYPASSTTGYSIRYGTANIQPFAPQLTSLSKLWPEYPRLGNTMSFGRATGTVLG